MNAENTVVKITKVSRDNELLDNLLAAWTKVGVRTLCLDMTPEAVVKLPGGQKAAPVLQSMCRAVHRHGGHIRPVR